MNGYVSSILQVAPFIVALVTLMLAVKKGKIDRSHFALIKPRSRSGVLFWILGFSIFVIAVELYLYSLGLLEVKHWNYPAGAKIIRAVGIIILAPITEELLLRGLLLSKLRNKGIPAAAAIIIQALVFVLLHAFAYENTLTSQIGIVQTFVDGCLFAVARLQTRSIVTSIGMHMCGNAIAVMERVL